MGSGRHQVGPPITWRAFFHFLILSLSASPACTRAEHRRYSGQFRDNLRNGRGVQVYPNGDRYKGLFVADVRHGFGVQVYPNQDVYRGDWFDDQRVNDVWTGIKHYDAPQPATAPPKPSDPVPDYVPPALRVKRDRYVGEFKGLNRHGQGVCEFADGSKYVGSWEDDMFEGHGTITYA